ncbi:MAG: hypothetical protein GDA50_08330, partial [Alphaproteobacteria bacterium GM202ARS2]|nr:hypothetical protein [Alphaproteobacteria bacterium GM202ARS2]
VALLFTPLIYFHRETKPRLNIYRRPSDSAEVFATLMGHRALLQKVPFRAFFRSKEDPDFCLRVAEHAKKTGKFQKQTGAQTGTMLADALYAVRQSSHNKRSTTPHQTIYYALAVISAAHRSHGLRDPVDGADTLQDAIDGIDRQFPRIVADTPALAETITRSLSLDALQEYVDGRDKSPYREGLIARCFPVHRRGSVGAGLTRSRDNAIMLKRHLYHAIASRQRDAYVRGLQAMGVFLDSRSQRRLKRKVLFACLKRGRIGFIAALLRI